MSNFIKLTNTDGSRVELDYTQVECIIGPYDDILDEVSPDDSWIIRMKSGHHFELGREETEKLRQKLKLSS